MRSLFTISDDLLALADLLTETGGEVTADESGAALEQWFDALGTERDAKLDNYCALIAELNARSEARRAEAERINQLADADANAAANLKKRLHSFFVLQGLKKVETSRFKITLANNGGALPLIYPEAWRDNATNAPEQFHKRIIALDTSAIRAAIDAGEDVPDCSLGERGQHLRIK